MPNLIGAALRIPYTFAVTLYVQKVLGPSPLETGLIFGVPGLASMSA